MDEVSARVVLYRATPWRDRRSLRANTTGPFIIDQHLMKSSARRDKSLQAGQAIVVPIGRRPARISNQDEWSGWL
jgi:hypothetical protein